MLAVKAVVILSTIILQESWSVEYSFPLNFKFGASTSSYQIEGGWNADGKGEHMWDRFVHNHREKIKNNATGDVAADSYHLWQEDVRIAAELGLQFYRFSISWPRILPTGFSNNINNKGIQYYSNLIDALLAKGIEPIVTLYHWELPVKIQDVGGWTNPYIVDWFGDYARVVFSVFAGRVKTWITINEAISICDYSYNTGIFAPGIKETEFAPFICNKNVLLAHAMAYRIYEREFKPLYEAQISLANYELWIEPATPDDEALAELGREHSIGRFSNPIYSKEGGWPPSVEKMMLEYSLKQGYNRSRLPDFTRDEIQFIKGTSDFYSMNHYTTNLIRPAKPGEDTGIWIVTGSPELNAVLIQPPGSENFGPFPLLVVYPKGIRRHMSWIRQKYGNIDIMVLENGFSKTRSGLNDLDRINYIGKYLEQILLAIKEDNVSVTGYSMWSLIDNFEWLDGFTTTICACAVVESKLFPPGFKFGAATAAYQVEGAWNVSDKSESVWDHFVHSRPENVVDFSTGDVACDSYNQWKRDVEIAEDLGLHFYRFSIGWTRLMPKGFSNYVSEDGKNYYNNLINALLDKGIEPVITMYHWDLPQSLQDLGGWTNPLISDWFAEYARVVFSLFADRVKIWITLNEPIVFCEVAYSMGVHAPGIVSPGIGNFMCNKNTLLAHAKAWRIYDKEFRPKYHGKVSLTNQILWVEARNESDEDTAELARQLMAGMYSHPIFSKEGGWPPMVEAIMAKKSKKEGRTQSRLPPFTKEEINLIKGTYDFYGFNYYTSRIAHKAQPREPIGLWPLFGNPEFEIVMSTRTDWKLAATNWFYVNAPGFRHQLRWLKKNYGDVEIFITENGFAGYDFGLKDYDRVQYYKDHLEQVLLAINEDGVNVTRYTAWTMLDNFEWNDGYRSKFGLYQVDFEDPKRPRHPRASAHYYKRVIQHHSFDIDGDNKINDEL
ncbi:unnamed protein product, partial [Brenthis ino]